jgi:hypothetical protein
MDTAEPVTTSTLEYDDESDQIARQLAGFIPIFEELIERMRELQTLTETRISTQDASFAQQLENIQARLTEFSDIMTQAGVARWRHVAESAMKQGDEHVHAIKQATDHLLHTVDESSRCIDQIIIDAVSSLTEATQSLEIGKIEQIYQHTTQRIEDTTLRATRKLNRRIRTFFWEHLLLNIAFVVIITLGFGYFINDQWPWEERLQAHNERDAGKTFLKIWPQLTEAEQQRVAKLANT